MIERVEQLVDVWAELSKEVEFPYTGDHCINGSRVAVEVLRNFGIRATPISVRMMVFNRTAFELHVAGVPVGAWPDWAWSVGVDPALGMSALGRWNGHLICEGRGWTLDLSAGQFHRPGRIHAPGPVWVPHNLPRDGSTQMFTDARGQVICLGREPTNDGWRTAPGWQLTPTNRQMIERCINRMSAEQQGKEPDGTASN